MNCGSHRFCRNRDRRLRPYDSILLCVWHLGDRYRGHRLSLCSLCDRISEITHDHPTMVAIRTRIDRLWSPGRSYYVLYRYGVGAHDRHALIPLRRSFETLSGASFNHRNALSRAAREQRIGSNHQGRTRRQNLIQSTSKRIGHLHPRTLRERQLPAPRPALPR